MNLKPALIAIVSLLLSACAQQVDLSYFEGDPRKCFNRQKHQNIMIVDAHHHFRPYGGPARDYQQMLSDIRKAGVLFVTGYGIGQTLPQNSQCRYPANCPNTPIKPNIDNDIANANNQQKWPSEQPIVNLSMSFFDLNQPKNIKKRIQQLRQQYPGQFNWAGEVNLVKQALFRHGHQIPNLQTIKHWQPFMDLLADENIPIAIHSDIGNDHQATQYLSLFDNVLNHYPNNIIVWLHMGISKEQLTLPVSQHIDILRQRLIAHPNLYLDLSWRILQENYFNSDENRQLYVDLIHQFPDRFITGSDIVTSKSTNYKDYKGTLRRNSALFPLLNDNAYRSIVLGQNYFKLAQMANVAPMVCITN